MPFDTRSQNWKKKKIISLVISVLLSVRMKQLGSHWADFHEILNLSIFRKSAEKIQGT